jgi:hypothetical protein
LARHGARRAAAGLAVPSRLLLASAWSKLSHFHVVGAINCERERPRLKLEAQPGDRK